MTAVSERQTRIAAHCALNVCAGTFTSRVDFEQHLMTEHNVLPGQLTPERLTAIAWCGSDARLPWDNTATAQPEEKDSGIDWDF